ncbi:hypothetical protein B0H10DRAFT_2273863 [Mycena sp. CBHHK59/15]|nr:hypothetical protein B0H10DRAFT_2273863 [Mycena sp. CBHHK59/15]
MLPPMLPFNVQPRISVPSTWTSPAFSHPPPPAGWPVNQQSYSAVQQSPSYGYSSAHSQYHANRQAWGEKSYQGTLETITVQVKVLRESGKGTGVLVHNLREGVLNILANSTPPTLITLAFDTIKDKLVLVMKGYPFNWKRVVVREIGNWVDLAKQNPYAPYFYQRCMTGRPKGKNGSPTFKKPLKAFEIALIIDPEQWADALRFVAEMEQEEEERRGEANNVSGLGPEPNSGVRLPARLAGGLAWSE